MSKFSMTGFYRAQVVSVDDPDKLGRIKARVFPVFKDFTVDVIPWAVPAMPLFNGSVEGAGSFCVPAINSFVWVFFEAGSVYQPVYFAEAPTAVHGIPASSVTNYPSRRIMRTSAGLEVIFDDVAKSISLLVSETIGISISETNGLVCTLGDHSLSISTEGAAELNCTSFDVNADSFKWNGYVVKVNT